MIQSGGRMKKKGEKGAGGVQQTVSHYGPSKIIRMFRFILIMTVQCTTTEVLLL